MVGEPLEDFEPRGDTVDLGFIRISLVAMLRVDYREQLENKSLEMTLAWTLVIIRKLVKPTYNGASLVAQLVKNWPAVPETWVRSLGREDTLEKEMATHSSMLVWKISWTEKPGGLQSMGSQRVGMTG